LLEGFEVILIVYVFTGFVGSGFTHIRMYISSILIILIQNICYWLCQRSNLINIIIEKLVDILFHGDDFSNTLWFLMFTTPTESCFIISQDFLSDIIIKIWMKDISKQVSAQQSISRQRRSYFESID